MKKNNNFISIIFCGIIILGNTSCSALSDQKSLSRGTSLNSLSHKNKINLNKNYKTVNTLNNTKSTESVVEKNSILDNFNPFTGNVMINSNFFNALSLKSISVNVKNGKDMLTFFTKGLGNNSKFTRITALERSYTSPLKELVYINDLNANINLSSPEFYRLGGNSKDPLGNRDLENYDNKIILKSVEGEMEFSLLKYEDEKFYFTTTSLNEYELIVGEKVDNIGSGITNKVIEWIVISDSEQEFCYAILYKKNNTK